MFPPYAALTVPLLFFPSLQFAFLSPAARDERLLLSCGRTTAAHCQGVRKNCSRKLFFQTKEGEMEAKKRLKISGKFSFSKGDGRLGMKESIKLGSFFANQFFASFARGEGEAERDFFRNTHAARGRKVDYFRCFVASASQAARLLPKGRGGCYAVPQRGSLAVV